jgi:beta-lactamase class A
MWSKTLLSILIALHLAPATPVNTLPAQQNSAPTAISQSDTQNNTKVTVGDEIYADLALQHELDHVSVYYFDNNPDNIVSINSDKHWDPASTIKLFASMYAFDQVSHGNMSLDQNVTIDANNVAASQSYADGYPALNAGDTVTVFRILDQMITQSDNTAYNTLLDLLDRQQITKYIHDLGLTSSSVGSKLNLDDSQQQIDFGVAGHGTNMITANDYAKAFVLINGKRIPGSAELFDILSRQKLNTMLPHFLPKEVTVAHKTGELDPYYHDGGIIVDNSRRYILSVFSNMGDPNVVAHISDLVYSNNKDLVGKNQASKPSLEYLNNPVDPLVLNGEPLNSAVLAANTLNVKIPKVTASDLGILASDLSPALNSKQLPPVIISPKSPLHVLIDLGEQLRVTFNPIPELKTIYQTQNLKQKLAEASDLAAKGDSAAANSILNDVNNGLTDIAQSEGTNKNINLQKQIDQISETRFTILGSELASNENKDEVIKEAAKEAEDTTKNIKPFIPDAVNATDLSQSPTIGQVVNVTPNSITIKTSDGNEITKSVDSEIKTRDTGTDNSTVTTTSDIALGSTIALTGSFALTNIAPDSANPNPVTVLKVNNDTNSIVILSSDGTPQQVDLTSDSVIKGSDTTVSLDQIKPGDVIIVHGDGLPAAAPSSTPIATTTPIESSNPNGTSSPNQTNNPSATNLPVGNGTPISMTPTPIATPIPTASTTTKPAPIATSKATTPAKATPVPTKTPTPQVIKGNVIQVVQQTVPTTSPAPKTTPVPTPVPTGIKK